MVNVCKKIKCVSSKIKKAIDNTDAFKIEVKPTNKTYTPIDIVMTINGIGAGNLYGLFNVLQYLDLEFLTQTGVNCGLDGVLILTITEI